MAAAPAGHRDTAGPRDVGYGLTTMRERAERWGGTVTVGPGKNSGTLVRLAVPLNGGISLVTAATSPTAALAAGDVAPREAR
jgi:signal transduction histidine kinase